MKRLGMGWMCGGLWGFVVFSARLAGATQPLESFLERAKTQSFEAREATATERQRAAEADVAIGRLTPSVSARGVYTRNQYEAAVQLPGTTTRLVIVPP